MKVLAIAVFLVIAFETSAYRIKAYFPPKSAKRESRLTLSGTVPPLKEVTICHWVKAHSMKPKGMFVVSYAHGQAADELLTGVVVNGNETSLVFAVRNKTAKIRRTELRSNSGIFTVGSWHHLCFTWSSGDGNVKGFVDGIAYSTPKQSLEVGQEIRSGGVLMIGQDQDVYNGKLDLDESWDGFISDVQIWDEAFTQSEISAMAKCEQREGNVFAWLRDPLVAEDGVVLSRTTLCSHKD